MLPFRVQKRLKDLGEFIAATSFRVLLYPSTVLPGWAPELDFEKFPRHDLLQQPYALDEEGLVVSLLPFALISRNLF